MKNKLISAILSVLFICASVAIMSFANDAKLGDLDNNGAIEAADARLALRISAKLDVADEATAKIADVDFNGKITAADARLILRVAAHIDSFETETDAEDASTEETTTEEPTTEEPTTEEPTTEAPTTEEPTTEEPTTEEPTTEEPTTEEPTTEEPTTEEPTSEEPTTEEPTTEEPTTEEPTTEEPTTEEPTTEEPTTEEPTTEEPTTEEPTTEEPTTEEPTTEEPTTEEPTTEEPTTEPEPDTGVVVTEYPEIIDTFLSGNYYVEGSIVTEEETAPLDMAVNGTDVEMKSTIDNVPVSVMTAGDAIYLKFTGADDVNYYLDESIISLIPNVNFSKDAIFNKFIFEPVDALGDIILKTETVDGVEYDTYSFQKVNGGCIVFYFDSEGKLVMVNGKDAEGNDQKGLIVESLTALQDAPEGVLSLEGYTAGQLADLYELL